MSTIKQMTSLELAEAIWRDPETRYFLQNDWTRWMNSGYHVTKEMELDTLIESAYSVIDPCGIEWFNGDRDEYYQQAETPEVISYLSEWLYRRTPEHLRPIEAKFYDHENWLIAIKRWAKSFFRR